MTDGVCDNCGAQENWGYQCWRCKAATKMKASTTEQYAADAQSYALSDGSRLRSFVSPDSISVLTACSAESSAAARDACQACCAAIFAMRHVASASSSPVSSSTFPGPCARCASNASLCLLMRRHSQVVQDYCFRYIYFGGRSRAGSVCCRTWGRQ